MKEPPQEKRLHEILSSSKLVQGGFLGTDRRSLSEIIDSDSAELSKAGFSAAKIASRMQEITDAAVKQLGGWVKIDDYRKAKVDEAKGSLVCPWPHPGQFAKRVTTVRLIETGRSVKWSDLNIHLIAEHSFFEGKGSNFRLEPKELVEILF